MGSTCLSIWGLYEPVVRSLVAITGPSVDSDHRNPSHHRDTVPSAQLVDIIARFATSYVGNNPTRIEDIPSVFQTAFSTVLSIVERLPAGGVAFAGSSAPASPGAVETRVAASEQGSPQALPANFSARARRKSPPFHPASRSWTATSSVSRMGVGCGRSRSISGRSST